MNKINKEHFCNLEKDEKGFQILTEYLEKCRTKDDIFIADNKIQIKECEVHMYRNWLDKNADLHWVEEYAEAFRRYLNSLKILWAAHVLEHGNDKEFTYEEYCKLINNWKKTKEVLEGMF